MTLWCASIGELHNNIRMTWGKAILPWSPDPDTAIKRTVYLNHKYALDGCDPCSYSGILWCYGVLSVLSCMPCCCCYHSCKWCCCCCICLLRLQAGCCCMSHCCWCICCSLCCCFVAHTVLACAAARRFCMIDHMKHIVHRHWP